MRGLSGSGMGRYKEIMQPDIRKKLRGRTKIRLSVSNYVGIESSRRPLAIASGVGYSISH